VELFIQEVLDHSKNREWINGQADREKLSRDLWHEGLVTVYRLLVILKLESSDDPARSFSFASTSLWRNSYSPGLVLARFAHDVLERGVETGAFLESGLRSLFRMFEIGLSCTELVVKPLGGGLFGEHVTPILSRLAWGERAVAHLMDQLLWTTPLRKGGTRERVHYGPLDVEDLGRVYEALLELEPGISAEPMCRLRRQKLEVVVPVAQGERYRPASAAAVDDGDDTDDSEDEDDTDDEEPVRGKKTKVEWIEEIPPGRFYLRVGLGRKASGSYYTPHSFVRFLVQETLGPQIAERSPHDNPDPMAILKLKALDPAMGSGHFLVEACRFIADRLYEACRLCDEKAMEAQKKADELEGSQKETAQKEADMWLQRVIDLPDPDDEILKYLPSRSPEGEESGYSQKKAAALCRRIVAAHCLYGVDKNPLAVELAKVSLWIESHAEGMPLTFLDHRLVVGDSLTGPFWHHLIMKPASPREPIDGLFTQNLDLKFQNALSDALSHVKYLEASVGINVFEIEEKAKIKADMDQALMPFRVAAAAWSGGVMLGTTKCDEEAYEKMLETIASTGDLPGKIESPLLRGMIARGYGLDAVPEGRDELYAAIILPSAIPALSYDFTFPEVFYPKGIPHGRQGFDVVLGNPPWDTVTPKEKEWFAAIDITVLDARTKSDRECIQNNILKDTVYSKMYEKYLLGYDSQKAIYNALYIFQKVIIEDDLAGRFLDLFRIFLERNTHFLKINSITGVVVPAAFHANAGASGVRRLYIEKMKLMFCFSFENRKKIFEIHSSFKFDLIAARSSGTTEYFPCAFYIDNENWIFNSHQHDNSLSYSVDFIKKTGGEYLNFLEIKDITTFNIINNIYNNAKRGEITFKNKPIEFATNPVALNITKDRKLIWEKTKIINTKADIRKPEGWLSLQSLGYWPLMEGKYIHQFTDLWESSPNSVVKIEDVASRKHLISYTRYYYIVCREVTGSTNERTVISTIIPPGRVTAYTLVTERNPAIRPNSYALQIISVFNSFSYDYIARLSIQTHFNLTILRNMPWWKPNLNLINLVVHSSLRLISNHSGFITLWHEQLGETWREPNKKPFTWPIIDTEEKHCELSSAIDAVVAEAYGLNREQYIHVLSTFNHKTYPQAPELCLGKFDELKEIGLDTFTKKYDPYWDIPLNENLPKPVIDLPIPDEPHVEETGSLFAVDEENTVNIETKKKRGRKK